MRAARTYGGVSAGRLREMLGVPALHLFYTVPSTQDVAHARAQAGAEAGTVVVTDAQQAGRGRLGRPWISEAGQGVWCTVIEKGLDPLAVEVLSLRVGMAIAERLDAVAGEIVLLKWPNDLYLHGAKLGGILAEARWSGDQVGWVAIGVGVNAAPPQSVAGATGLPEGAGRVEVLGAIVAGVRAAARASGALREDELERFRSRDFLSGREIAAPEQGIVRGIAPSGALLVETPQGVRHVRSGTVEMAEGVA